ncbi:MAG: penicillin-binding transpeptidase domain-containing protein [Pseudomonadota bacterium]
MDKMKKLFSILFSFLIAPVSVANTVDFSKYFNEKSGCFILFDVTNNKLITKYNPARCKEQIPPASTFKLPLSVMAFDQKLIKQDTVFKWDGKTRSFSLWNQDQSPQTWLKNSVVWVSQVLTPKIGLDKINYYLKQFNYGNQDFSGGLSHAWLHTSLKISADEQLNFLKRMLMEQLPVSPAAMADTKANMYLETSPKGWKLYGKTGTGSYVHDTTNYLQVNEDAWFVGYVQKASKAYVFVLNYSDLEEPNTGGRRAKGIAKDLLQELGLY